MRNLAVSSLKAVLESDSSGQNDEQTIEGLLARPHHRTEISPPRPKVIIVFLIWRDRFPNFNVGQVLHFFAIYRAPTGLIRLPYGR